MYFMSVRCLEGRMDEGVELAKLQLEGEVEIELPRQRAKLGDDAQAMVDVAHVIIGELEDEQRLGNGLGRRGGRLVKHDRCPRVVAGRRRKSERPRCLAPRSIGLIVRWMRTALRGDDYPASMVN